MSETPEVLRFSSRLTSDGDAPDRVVLDVPKAISAKLRGMARVEGTINGHPFRAPVDASAGGGVRFTVNKAMRAGAKAQAGDVVRIAILGPEPAPVPPPDLRAALKASPNATVMWAELDDEARRDYIRWVAGAKKPETRARRVTRTIDQLAEGKRRPCCVNMYDYALTRIGES